MKTKIYRLFFKKIGTSKLDLRQPYSGEHSTMYEEIHKIRPFVDRLTIFKYVTLFTTYTTCSERARHSWHKANKTWKLSARPGDNKPTVQVSAQKLRKNCDVAVNLPLFPRRANLLLNSVTDT